MTTNEILLEKLHLLQVHNLALEENRAFNSLILDGLDAILKNDSNLVKYNHNRVYTFKDY